MKANYKKLAVKYKNMYKEAAAELDKRDGMIMWGAAGAAIDEIIKAQRELNAKMVAYDMLQERYNVLLREYAELQERVAREEGQG